MTSLAKPFEVTDKDKGAVRVTDTEYKVSAGRPDLRLHLALSLLQSPDSL